MISRSEVIELRRKVINLASSLAYEETKETGEDYNVVISKSLQEACKRLDIDHKQFIKLFI